MMKDDSLSTFETSLKKLETIVKTMQNGELPLDQSMKQFEEGINLIRSCQHLLKEAEQKVKILTSSHTLKDFDHDNFAE